LAGLACSRDTVWQPAKVALVAVMRKLLTVLNAMIKQRAPWNPNAPTVNA
jgi:hypothetical protein